MATFIQKPSVRLKKSLNVYEKCATYTDAQDISKRHNIAQNCEIVVTEDLLKSL